MYIYEVLHADVMKGSGETGLLTACEAIFFD